MSEANDSSRRDFLRTSALAAGAALVGAAPAAAAKTAPPADKWDRQADVVIAGSGAAALSAAIAAISAGSSVILIEKAAAAGGTSAKADGGIWIPNNRHMAAKGIADPRDRAIDYMVRYSYPHLYSPTAPRHGAGATEHALIATFYDEAAPAIALLEKVGALDTLMFELPDYFEHAPQNAAPRGRVLFARKRDGSIGPGAELVRQLKSWLAARKVPLLIRHRASAILRGANGEVSGIEATSPAGTVRIGARKGVIFATGGYIHDPKLVLNFQPGPVYGGCAVPTAEGDFVRLGIENGAMLGNMWSAWRGQALLDQIAEGRSVPRLLWQPPGDSMIMVNKFGRRVVNEKRDYHDRTRVHFVWDPVNMEYPNQALFMIFDRRSAELFAGNFPFPDPGTTAPWMISAPTLPALGAAVQQRLDQLAPAVGQLALAPAFAAGLAEEIATFSADAAKGVDPRFDRGRHPYDNEWHARYMSVARTDTRWKQGASVTLHPFEPNGPYHAIILVAAALDTNGGPTIDPRARVIDVRGRPIPGLYGAGNCIAAPSGPAYWGGGATLGQAITYGVIAGREAAARAAT